MMAKAGLQVLERGEALNLLSPLVAPGEWTAIVPAAGRGSRLMTDGPKILYCLAGRPLLDHLLELLEGLCSRVVLVLSPEGLGRIEPHLSRIGDRRIATVVQEHPCGMADAVNRGLPLVPTEQTIVIWGDQAAIRRSSVELAIRLHAGPTAPAATLPTVLQDRPYIHFERGACGELVGVLQAREGDPMPVRGESDCGVFLFQTQILRRFLPGLLTSSKCVGRKTGELNFLPVLPMITSAGETVISARIPEADETLGLNTPDDAARLDLMLCRRAKT